MGREPRRQTLSRIDPTKRRLDRDDLAQRHSRPGVAIGRKARLGCVWVIGTLARVAPEFNRVNGTVQTSTFRSTYGRGVVTSARRRLGRLRRFDRGTYRSLSLRVRLTTFAGNSPSAIAFGNGSLWVVNTENSDVSRFSRPAYVTAVVISVGQHPRGVAVGDGAVWVTDTSDDDVSRIDPSTKLHQDPSHVGRAPVGIAYGAGAVWVANSGDGTVSRIDPATSKVVATIRVGNTPSGIAVDAGTVWVTVQAPPAGYLRQRPARSRS